MARGVTYSLDAYKKLLNLADSGVSRNMLVGLHEFMEIDHPGSVGESIDGDNEFEDNISVAGSQKSDTTCRRGKRFESVSHHKTLMETLNRQRSDARLCDVTLNVGSKQIHAHRIILSGGCQYFRTMLNSNFRESKQEEIAMSEVDEDAMEQIVSYMYTACIDIDFENAESILKVAHLLQLDEVKEWCSEFLRREICSSNCIGIADFAEIYSCDRLLRCADDHLRNKFLKVAKCEEFFGLSFARLVTVVSDASFYVNSEKELYCSLMSWVKFDAAGRKQYLSQLLACVRLPLLGIEYLKDAVATDSLVAEDEACCKLVEEAEKYLESVRVRPKAKEALFVVDVGGSCLMIDNVELWPADWRRVPRINGMFQDVADVACLKGRVYVTCCEGNMVSYNLSLKEWTDCPPHALCPVSTRLVAVKQYLYAVGRSKREPGTTFQPMDFQVKRYNPKNKRWADFAVLWGANPRIRFSVVELNGLIYVVGGTTSFGRAINLIDCFDPVTKDWTTQDTFIQTAPVDTAAVAFNGRIYVAGGRELRLTDEEDCIFIGGQDDEDDDFEECDTSVVRCWDPVTNRWASCGQLSTPRAKLSLVVLNSKLCAVSGTSDGRLDTSVQVYDELTNAWSCHDGMRVPCFSLHGGARCTVVPCPFDFAALDKRQRDVHTTSRVDTWQLRPKPSDWVKPDVGEEFIIH